MKKTEIVYGFNPVFEVLRASRRVCREVFISLGKKESRVSLLKKEAGKRGIQVRDISREEMGRLVGNRRHQGVAASIGPYPFISTDDILNGIASDRRNGFLLILDGIMDPQNLGSLIRTSHLIGVHGIVVSRDNAAPVTPAVVKASAGATEHSRISQPANIVREISYLKEKGFWIVGLDMDGSEFIYRHDFTRDNIAVVLGSEGKGMRRLVRKSCDYLLKIPMEGVVDSYNVSVAGAILLSEVARQRWVKNHANFVPSGS